MTDARDIVERLRNFAINTLAIIPEKIERHPKTDPELIVAGFSRQCDMATEAADEIASLRKQLEDALEALGFYGREANYRTTTMYMSGRSGQTAIDIDGGKRAREALKGKS